MNDRLSGVPREPIVLNPEVVVTSTQALWSQIERTQEWSGDNVLNLGTPGAYIELARTSPLEDRVGLADQLRADGTHYSDSRGLDQFTRHFKADGPTIVTEFLNRSVLDIGSGQGVLANELRRYTGARVIELDFSQQLFDSLPSLSEEEGERIVADGTNMPMDDGIVDRTISLYSTTKHTVTVEERLRAYTEAFRVTRPGGSVFAGPIFSEMFKRQEIWTDPNERRFDVESFRQAAARDFALTAFIRSLVKEKRINFTPILIYNRHGFLMQQDAISGIFDVLEPFSKAETDDLIAPHVSLFKTETRVAPAPTERT